MLTTCIKRLPLLLCCGVGFFLFAHLQVPLASAAGATVTITQPSAGHVGTKVHIDGSGFKPGIVTLYTTTNGDPTRCTSGDPGSLGLQIFSTDPTVTAQQDGTFSIDATWPDNAGNAGSAYHICATSPGVYALSSSTFTVAPPVTINVSPTSVPQGGKVTITGANWLPPQSLTVAVVSPTQAGDVASGQVTPDSTGTFSISLIIPTSTPLGTYSVSASADSGDQTLKTTKARVLTVTAMATPTPTATPSPTPTATPVPTATAAATPTQSTSGSGGSDGTNTFLLYTMGGLGVLLVIVGIILFVMYSRGR